MHYINCVGARIFPRAGFRAIALACLFFPALGLSSVDASTRFSPSDGRFDRPSLLAGRKAPCLLQGKLVGVAEAGQVRGGDTRVKIDKTRTKLTVEVIDNEYEARLGRLPPKETYVLDVHNRVVSTTMAPFMPKAGPNGKAASAAGLTCSPQPFPAGYWAITGVRQRDDKYGPYSIQTNAVGYVDVFRKSTVDGRMEYVGTLADTNYSLHSNTIPFDRSQSFGCCVLKPEDSSRLAQTLIKDKEENKNAKQTLYVEH